MEQRAKELLGNRECIQEVLNESTYTSESPAKMYWSSEKKSVASS